MLDKIIFEKLKSRVEAYIDDQFDRLFQYELKRLIQEKIKEQLDLLVGRKREEIKK